MNKTKKEKNKRKNEKKRRIVVNCLAKNDSKERKKNKSK